MAKIEWRKHPSVTTGGKAYFLTGIVEGILKYRIVWHRIELVYVLQVEDNGTKTLGYYKTVNKAMKSIS